MEKLILYHLPRPSAGGEHPGMPQQATQLQHQATSCRVAAVVDQTTGKSLQTLSDPAGASQLRSEQQCDTWSGGLSVMTSNKRKEGNDV